MKRISLGLSLIAALGLGSAQAQQVVKIATMSPLSGQQSNLGLQIRNGAQLAVSQYQAQFRALGMTLQLVPYDDRADPATGTAAARRIAADREVLAVVGTLNSGVAIPASEALRASRVAMVSPANTGTEVTDRGLPNMNRIVARDDAQGPAGASYIVNNLRAQSVYIINDKTAYGEGLAREVERSLRERGIRVLQNEGTEERNNFSAIIAKIRLQRPDVIYFGGIYDQIGVFIRQLRGAGINTPVVGGDGMDSTDLITIAGANNLRGVFFTTVAPPVNSIPAAAAFANTYQRSFNAPAQGYGVMAYDATRVVLDGILAAARANNNRVPSRQQVETAIRRGTFTGLLTGNVSFNSVGDRSAATMYIISAEGGQFRSAGSAQVRPPRQ